MRRAASVGCAVRTSSSETRSSSSSGGDARRAARTPPRATPPARAPRGRTRAGGGPGAAARRRSRAGSRGRTRAGRSPAGRAAAPRPPPRSSSSGAPPRASRASARTRSTSASSCSPLLLDEHAPEQVAEQADVPPQRRVGGSVANGHPASVGRPARRNRTIAPAVRRLEHERARRACRARRPGRRRGRCAPPTAGSTVLDGRDEPVEARRRVEARDRPRVGVAGRDPLERGELRPDRPRGRGRARARRPARSSSAVRTPQVVERPREEQDADVDPLAAVDPRHEPVDGVRERLTRGHGPPPRPRRTRAARRAGRAGSRRTRADSRPRASRPGSAAAISSSSGRVTSGASSASASAIGAGVRQQHVLGDLRERRPLVPGRRLRRVVEEERRAVVDQPQPAVPEQEVRVARRPVDVRHERVEPDDAGRELRLAAQAPRRARTGSDAGQEVDAEVEARRSPGADPGSPDPARRRASAGSSSTSASSGMGSPSARPSSPATSSADERLRPLPGAAQLQHVEPVVRRLDERRQRRRPRAAGSRSASPRSAAAPSREPTARIRTIDAGRQAASASVDPWLGRCSRRSGRATSSAARTGARISSTSTSTSSTRSPRRRRSRGCASPAAACAGPT